MKCKLPVKSVFFFLVLISASISDLFLLSVSAEETKPGAGSDTIKILDQLPEPAPDMRNGLAINNYNAGEFEELIIPELRSELRSGMFHATAFSHLLLEPAIGASYTAAPVEPALSESGALQTALSAVSGPLFTPLRSDAVALHVAKLLWNTHSVWWSARYLEASISLHFIRNDTIFRTYSARYERVYPRSLNAEDKTTQLFRSRLAFSNPAVIDNFSWLRFRFQSEDEDVLFMYSPTIKKTRQLTASNSTDPLLGSSLTLDDMLLFSGKVDGMTGVAESVSTYFVPLIPVQFGAAGFGSSDTCERYTLENPQLLWNFSTRLYPPGASWLPTAAAYIPRVLQRVTLNPNDPYSVYGRQVLYIDSALGVPVYKVVYDPSGSLWKVMILVYGVDADSTRTRSITPVQQIILDQKADQVSLLQFDSVKTCTAIEGDPALRRFSPAGLLPQQAVKSTEPAAPTSVTSETTVAQ